MHTMIQAARILLLICSLSGYLGVVWKKGKIQTEFVPVFVFTTIACVVYFFGLADILWIGSLIVFLLGLVFFFLWVVLLFKRKLVFFIQAPLFLTLFVVGSLPFFYQLLHSTLIHYDNFSHWAIVLKQILSTNAFPDAASELIDFKNYPLGTTSFLYYVCRFAGEDQGIMLAGQGIMIFSCFYALFGIIRQKQRFLLYGFLAAGLLVLSIFNITIRINNLLVDFLLPIVTLVLFAIIYRCKNKLNQACVVVVPIAGFLMIIKNTGVIYAGMGLMYLVFQWIKNRDKNFLKRGLAVGLTIAASLVPFLLWSHHTTVKFRGVENKFETSLNQIALSGGGKNSDEIRQISTLFFQSVFDIHSRPFMGILGFHLAVLAATLIGGVVLKKKWNIWKVLIALDGVLVIYYLGILALYLYSMPLDEAIRLAGFDRYASSIVILFAGGLILCGTVDIEHSFYYQENQMPAYRAFKSVESKGWYQKGVIVCLAVAVILLLSEYNGMDIIRKGTQNTLPYKVCKITGDRWYRNGLVDKNRYLFYASDENSQVTNYYLQYIGKYMLYASQVDGICAFYEDNLIHLLHRYEYLVIVESDVQEKYLLKKHFSVTGETGVYQIHISGDKVALEKIDL
ncbi:hypothetical protein [Clostridium sp. E02]|uniref:hypothetical protein n=1 Tax=Clostridium sp. E02 TaxID=2487134 RepID=UPI000F544894|nr:hypothetical protein [Clostridium sp. E02]